MVKKTREDIKKEPPFPVPPVSPTGGINVPAFPQTGGGSGAASPVGANVPVYKDYENFSTVELPDGRKLMFRDSKEARAYTEKRVAEARPPQGTISPEYLKQQQQTQEAIAGIGLTPQEQMAAQAGLTEAPTDYPQALTAGAMGAVPSAIIGGATTAGLAFAGGKIGAVGGAAAGPGGAIAGAVIGAVGGALYGLWRGTQANIEKQKKGVISAADERLSYAQKNMRTMAMMASQDPGNADRYLRTYDEQLALAWQAYGQIKVETQGNLNKYIEDGTDILSGFEYFLEPGGTADIYGQKIVVALQTGTPLMITDDDLEFVPKI